MVRRFQHQERRTASEDEAAGLATLEDRAEAAAREVAAHLVDHQHVRPLGTVRAADQDRVDLARGDPSLGDPQGIHPGGFLAHEGTRGARDPVDDGDVAGQQVRQLGQEQRRAQVVLEPLVQVGARIGGLPQARQDRAIDRVVALAAARRHDEVERLLEGGLVLHAGGVEGQPRGVDAEPLPRLHLTLVAARGDLPVPGDRGRGMHRIGREGLGVGAGSRLRVEGREMGLDALARTGDEAEPGDDDGAVHGGLTTARDPGTDRSPAPARASAHRARPGTAWCGSAAPRRRAPCRHG